MPTLDVPKTANTFPAYEAAIRNLVTQHLELGKDAPILAVYFESIRFPRDPFLLEISPQFVGNSDERDWFEVTYGSTTGFLLSPNQRLHLLLTNWSEFQQAARENWPSYTEFADAVRRNRYITVYGNLVLPQSLSPAKHG